MKIRKKLKELHAENNASASAHQIADNNPCKAFNNPLLMTSWPWSLKQTKKHSYELSIINR